MSAKKDKTIKGQTKKRKPNYIVVTEPLKVALENKCTMCVDSKCCGYTTQFIDTPRTMKDFDFLMWQISHPHVHAYRDETGWFLIVVDVPCSHLLPDGACGIYEKRPLICREHTNEYCEFDKVGKDSVDLYFKGYEDLEVYCRKRFKKWDKRFKKWLKDK